jgi:hypothetical protein
MPVSLAMSWTRSTSDVFAAKVVADPASANKSTRDLGAETGLGQGTIARARQKSTVTNVTAEPVVDRNGRSHPATKPKPAPKRHYAAPEIIALHDAGKSNKEIAAETDIGERQVRHVVDEERIRRDAVALAAVSARCALVAALPVRRCGALSALIDALANAVKKLNCLCKARGWRSDAFEHVSAAVCPSPKISHAARSAPR